MEEQKTSPNLIPLSPSRVICLSNAAYQVLMHVVEPFTLPQRFWRQRGTACPSVPLVTGALPSMLNNLTPISIQHGISSSSVQIREIQSSIAAGVGPISASRNSLSSRKFVFFTGCYVNGRKDSVYQVIYFSLSMNSAIEPLYIGYGSHYYHSLNIIENTGTETWLTYADPIYWHLQTPSSCAMGTPHLDQQQYSTTASFARIDSLQTAGAIQGEGQAGW